MAGFGANFFINHGVVFNSKPAVEVSNEEKQEDVTKQIPVTDSTSTVSEQVGNEKFLAKILMKLFQQVIKRVKISVVKYESLSHDRKRNFHP